MLLSFSLQLYFHRRNLGTFDNKLVGFGLCSSDGMADTVSILSRFVTVVPLKSNRFFLQLLTSLLSSTMA